MTEPSSEQGATGATSLGAMVPVHASASATEADRLASLLQEHAIPALVQTPGAGFIGIPAPLEGAWVVVPASMREEAEALLIREQLIPRERFVQSPSSGSSMLAEETDVSIEPPVPEPGPLMPRAVAAASAIITAAVGQKILEIALGREVVMQSLAASTRHVEQWWRVVTASFVHASVSHHFFNAVFGLVLGVVLFGTHGYGATILVWLLSSATGMLAELWVSLDPKLVVGASAGNYGLIGLWAKGQLDRAQGAALPRRERLKTLGVLVLLVPGAMTPVSSFGSRTAVFAHVAGFLMGFVLGYVFLRRVRLEPDERLEQRSRYAFMVAASITICAFLSAGLFLASQT